MSNDIIERLRAAEALADGEVRAAIHDACREILWLREGVALSKRAVEIAEGKATSGVAVVVAVNPSRDQGPCTVCGVPWAKHGTAPTCASHNYTPGAAFPLEGRDA